MYYLGPAQLDSEKQLLTIGERTVALQRKPFQVLVYLIENRNRTIYRKELFDKFWDGKEVYDQSLSKAVGSIRKAFGETRESSAYIETRWGLGYRYVGPFTEGPATEPASLPESPSPVDTPVASLASKPAGSALSASGTSTLDVSDAPPRERQSWLGSFWRHYAIPTGVLAALLLLGVVGLTVYRSRQAARNHAAQSIVGGTPIRSLAVLPFTANTGNEEDKYLGLGISDAVATRLNTIPQLTIRSANTVRQLLGNDPENPAVGKRLQVQALVRGQVRRTTGNVVIGVQLVDSATGAKLWSGEFNAENGNIFATEDSIARQVSSALLLQFGANVLRQSPAPDTNSPEAYAKYMRAKFYASSRTQASLDKAVDLLKEAILLDPKFARAYAVLSDCYQLQGFYQFVPAQVAYRRSEAAAQKALSLDSSIVEAHASLLSALADYDRDWPGVEREFQAAIAADPNYAVAYQYHGYALMGMGHGEEGLAAMKHAAELDPVSPSIQTSLAWAYYLLRQDEQAVDQCKRVLEMYPDFVPVHQLLGIVYGQMHSDQRSMAELNQASALERDSPITPVLIDWELARTGRQSEAMHNLQGSHSGSQAPEYYLAAAYTALGDKQKALDYLRRAQNQRSSWLLYLKYDSRFDELRSEPQFAALLEQIDGAHGSTSVAANTKAKKQAAN
jgi:TolB-like protein/DNA-binding winged helix-turn-helix (wHTH) protein/predicted Zn-dependent protease